MLDPREERQAEPIARYEILEAQQPKRVRRSAVRRTILGGLASVLMIGLLIAFVVHIWRDGVSPWLAGLASFALLLLAPILGLSQEADRIEREGEDDQG